MTKAEPLYRYQDSCIAMFARAPVLGQVKTRLIPALGEQGALDMHLRLMNRQIEVLNQSSLCAAQLWLDKNKGHQEFNNFAGELKLQQGESLGDKMSHAAKAVLEQFSKVIIIGSDCPDMNDDYLELAIKALNDSAIDIVLGPALDGGYVLIGMKKSQQAIFEGVAWGSELVLQQTLDKIEARGLTHIKLPPLRDIDTAEDLKSLD